MVPPASTHFCIRTNLGFISLNDTIGIDKEDALGLARIAGLWGAYYAIGCVVGPVVIDSMMMLEVYVCVYICVIILQMFVNIITIDAEIL